VDYDIGFIDLDSIWYYDSWEILKDYPYAFMEENGFIRLISPPSTDDILWMAVARLPKITFTENNLNLTPDVPLQYHADLRDWILYEAYMKDNAETQDLPKATLYEKSFERKFGPRPTAQTEMNRRRYAPNMSMRSRQFGF
jgi:hypothetical protein